MEILIIINLFAALLLALVTAFLIKRFVFNRATKRSKTHAEKKFPSPARLPVIGNLHQLGRFPHRSLRSLALRYGPLMLLHLGRVPVLVASTADAAREIMKIHDHVFSSRPRSKLFQKLLYNQNDISAAPYGEYWRQMKSLSVLHLLSNKMVRSYRKVREEEISNMLSKISELVSTNSPINLNEFFTNLTNDVICRVALGRTYGDRKCKKLLKKLTELLGGFNVGDYIPWLAWVDRINGLDYELEKVAKTVDQFLEGVVQEHMDLSKNKGNGDEPLAFLDFLLLSKKEDKDGVDIDRLSIKALILDVFAAGTDTTSTALEWAMAELLKHPVVMARLKEEVRTITGQREYVSEDEIHKMKYLKCVFKETLRLHPPAPLLVPREATVDVTVQGYDVASGTEALVNAWAIGREVATWGEDAEEFRPERFMNSKVDFRGTNFELIPFGSGRRICPGISFATVVVETALANVIHRFDWTAAGEIDMAESFGITIHRKFPLVVSATHANLLPSDTANATMQ